MKSKNIKKALKSIIIFEGIALTTFIPSVSKAIGGINQSAQASFSEIGNTFNRMSTVATASPFGFSNLWFIALLLVAIGLPTLDIALKNGGNKSDS